MRQRFDEDAAARYEAWYETPEGQRADQLEKAALSQMLAAFPQGRTALEVGCGTGHFTRWLDEEGWAATGLDISPPMLKQAQVSGGRRLVRGDASRLPFADRAFDVSLIVTTLEFLPEPAAAVREALRVCRCGLVLGVLNQCSILGIRRRLAGLFRQTVYDDARFYSVIGLRRLLDRAAPRDGVLNWVTTLYPTAWPFSQQWGRWGGFIAMAFGLDESREAAASPPHRDHTTRI